MSDKTLNATGFVSQFIVFFGLGAFILVNAMHVDGLWGFLQAHILAFIISQSVPYFFTSDTIYKLRMWLWFHLSTSVFLFYIFSATDWSSTVNHMLGAGNSAIGSFIYGILIILHLTLGWTIAISKIRKNNHQSN